MNRLEEAKKVFDLEIQALKKTRDALGEKYLEILENVVECKGKVILTGMGKPGHIAKKLAATFASLGTPSFFLHPAEAMHGDLGMISKEDVVIAISYSGESDEIIHIIANIKLIGAKLIAITGNKTSTLAKAADLCQVLPEFEEACSLGLAPTSSTTVALCYGDSLAVVASEIYGFKAVDFGKYHPAGALGKKIVLKVSDVMVSEQENACVKIGDTLKNAIVELSKKGLGIVSVVDDNGFLAGVVTDGDLRRQLEKGANIYELNVEDIMSRSPVTIEKDCLAVEALNIIKTNNISALPVVELGRVVGTIKIQDIINVGIVG